MDKLNIKTRKLFFLLLLFACEVTVAQPDTLSFLHISDMHVIFNQPGYPPALMEYRKLKKYDQGENRLREFFQTVPENTKCDMVIATGDMIDFFEANTLGGRLLSLQAEQFAQLLNDFNIPVFLTLGNHEIFSFNWQVDTLKHNQNSAGRSRAAWIRNIPCFRDGTYYSETFRAGNTNYRFIFLDNGFYQFLPGDTTCVPYIDKSQLYWLNDQLSISGSDPVIIFMHIPFDPAKSAASCELYTSLIQNPSVKLILSGHYHRNAVDYYSEGDHKMVQVQTSALVNGAKNWRLVCLTENNILVSFTGGGENELVIPVR